MAPCGAFARQQARHSQQRPSGYLKVLSTALLLPDRMLFARQRVNVGFMATAGRSLASRSRSLLNFNFYNAELIARARRKKALGILVQIGLPAFGGRRTQAGSTT